MSISVIIVIVLLLSFAVSGIAQRLGFARPGRCGVEYLVLGVLLGPRASGIISSEAVATLTPFFSVVLGLVGFRAGLLLHGPSRSLRRAVPGVIAALFVGAAVTGLTLWALDGLGLDISRPHWFAIELGAIAMTANETLVRYSAERFGARGAVADLLVSTAAAMNVVAVLAFGATLAVSRAATLTDPLGLGELEWFLLCIGLGLVTGLFHNFFVAKDEGEDRQFLAVVGVLLFGSGIAYALGLSPLFVTVIAGYLVGASRSEGGGLAKMVERLEPPLEVVLLFALGILLEPMWGLSWAIVVLFPVARIAVLLIAAWLGLRIVPGPRVTRPGRALVGVGILGVAIGLDFALANREASALVIYALIAALVVTDLFAMPALRQVLADAGELHVVPAVMDAGQPPTAEPPAPPTEAAP
jgi:hypothetical protein